MPEKRSRTLLLVEDNANTCESWLREVAEFNSRDIAISFELEIAGNRDRALALLRRSHIDCAVIDLRIPAADDASSDDAKAESGNDVLKEILRASGMPAVVYSGYEEEVSELVEDSHIRVFAKRGGASAKILEHLLSHSSLMEAMANTRGKVSEEIARIFHQSIWPRWSKRWADLSGSWSPTDVITRQVVAHVAEALGDARSHHPDEFYFVPPLKTNRLGTGDLVRIDGVVHVLLNPRCNMDRYEYPVELTLARCETMQKQWDDLLARSKLEKQRSDALESTRRIASQDLPVSRHFIPMCNGEGPWKVQFDMITTVKRDDSSKLLSSRFATISPQFLPNLVQRYAAYLGRYGQPDLSPEILLEQSMDAKVGAANEGGEAHTSLPLT